MFGLSPITKTEKNLVKRFHKIVIKQDNSAQKHARHAKEQSKPQEHMQCKLGL